MERIHHRRRLLQLPIPGGFRRSGVLCGVHAGGADVCADHHRVRPQIGDRREDQCWVRAVPGGAGGGAADGRVVRAGARGGVRRVLRDGGGGGAVRRGGWAGAGRCGGECGGVAGEVYAGCGGWNCCFW